MLDLYKHSPAFKTYYSALFGQWQEMKDCEVMVVHVIVLEISMGTAEVEL